MQFNVEVNVFNRGSEMAYLFFQRDSKSGAYDIQTEHTFHTAVSFLDFWGKSFARCQKD